MPEPEPLVRAIDSLQLPVRDLDEALAFYRDELGHGVIWRDDDAVGLAMGDQPGTEIVLQTSRPDAETDLLVADVPEAVTRWIAAGGTIDVEPFDIPIGRCAVVRDPFGNRLVFLDMSHGARTGSEGRR